MACPENRKIRVDKMMNTFSNKTQEEKDLINEKRKNTVSCKVINTDKVLLVSKEEFDKRNDLVGVTKGVVGKFTKIEVYNDENILIHSNDIKFSEYCMMHNLPTAAFSKSYRANGKPLYINIDKGTEQRLIDNDNIKYKGWYALLK